jgi:hypothetical protein
VAVEGSSAARKRGATDANATDTKTAARYAADRGARDKEDFSMAAAPNT